MQNKMGFCIHLESNSLIIYHPDPSKCFGKQLYKKLRTVVK